MMHDDQPDYKHESRGFLESRHVTGDRGSILIGVLSLMLILAFVSLELSNLAGFKLHNTVHDQETIQKDLGSQAALEYGIWQLENDFTWRTALAGQSYDYAGVTYTLKALDSPLAGYENCVVITASASGSTESIGIGMRYPVEILMISDTENHRIRKVHLGTGIITTVAGDGSKDYSGDNASATAASLANPYQTALNSKSELLIADTKNNVVRKINSGGIITTVAGTGINGSAGDNGPAISATFSELKGVAADASDNLYIADTKNNRIRRVDAITKIITTVAGTGTKGYSGDNAPAVAAQLGEPEAIVFDSTGNFYFADKESHCIRRVDTIGIITTVAGTGTKGYSGDSGPAIAAKLNEPASISVDAAGNLYIADTKNHCIRRVDAVTRIITTYAGMPEKSGYNGDNIPATSAKLDTPRGICVTSSGDLFIADTENHRIRKMDGGTGIITTVAGTGSHGFSGDDGPADLAKLDKPSGVTFLAVMEVVPEIHP